MRIGNKSPTMELREIKLNMCYSFIRGNTDGPWYQRYKRPIIILFLVISICIIITVFFTRSKCAHCERLSSNDYLKDLQMLWWNESQLQIFSQCPSKFQANPPLVLISLDGFQADYFSRGLSPTLLKIADHGVKADFMYPVYPSKTFPNHFSIVTGLYPSSHGIIDNTIYDHEMGKFFKVGKTELNDTRWWQKEPIWVTAGKQGKQTATFFWPGSDVKINGSYPDMFYHYNGSIPYETRVDQVIEWLSSDSHPDFITLYFDEPDRSAHKFGPQSQQVNNAIVRVDRMVNRLLYGLQLKNLSNCINFLIVSDHGMSKIDCDKIIDSRKFANMSTVFSVLGAFGRLKPKDHSTSVDDLVSNFECVEDHMRVYRKEELPIRMHFVQNSRIEPVILDVDSGYFIVDQSIENQWKCSGGTHGYDNIFPDMRAIFLAYGPAFKRNITVKPFQNIELYELMCELLRINPQPNNGTKGSLHQMMLNPKINGIQPPELVSSPPIAQIPKDRQEFLFRVTTSKCPCFKEPEREMSPSEIKSRTEFHLPFGIPQSLSVNDDLVLLYNSDYIAAYDTVNYIPRWTGFTITEVKNSSEISICWIGDARVKNVFCSLTPDGISHRPLFPLKYSDFDKQRQALYITNSVLKSNYHVTNLEKEMNIFIERKIAEVGPVNVMMGPVFDPNSSGAKVRFNSWSSEWFNSSMLVPSHIFAVLTWCTYEVISPSECDSRYLDAHAFILPNFPYSSNCQNGEQVIKKNVARVADVEKISDLLFYNELEAFSAIRLRTSVSYFTI